MTKLPFNTISLEAYTSAQSDRVHNDDITANTEYLFAAKLETRDSLRAGEFYLKTLRVSNELGYHAILASVYNPADGDPFLILEGASHEGIITPQRPGGLHVTHPEVGSIGILKEGFLIAHPEIPAQLGKHTLHTLNAGAYADQSQSAKDFADTRTSSFERQGILLGYN